MMDPVTSVPKTQEKTSDSYQVLNHRALENRVQRCTSEVFGKDSLQGPCKNWDFVCSSDDCCFTHD